MVFEDSGKELHGEGTLEEFKIKSWKGDKLRTCCTVPDTDYIGIVKAGSAFACVSNIKELRGMHWVSPYSIWQLNQRAPILWKDLLLDPNVLCGQI